MCIMYAREWMLFFCELACVLVIIAMNRDHVTNSTFHSDRNNQHDAYSFNGHAAVIVRAKIQNYKCTVLT